MEPPYRLCVVTGTRAEYGLLRPLLRRVAADPCFEFRLLVTGMHLSGEFGGTYREIEDDGFAADAKIEMLLSSDGAAGMAKSTGLGMISFADYFTARRPDMLVALGDRFETFAAAASAAIMRIPIAHICGGDTSEGAVDEFFRHSITKMSALHFPSCEESRGRVIQLGESPDTVFNVGALNVECIKTAKLLSRAELARSLGISLDGDYAVVTFHPVTLALPDVTLALTDVTLALPAVAGSMADVTLTLPDVSASDSARQIEALLRALAAFPDIKFIVTKANADGGGRAINAALDRAAARMPNIAVFASLGSTRYLSALRYASAVIGNSSSGLYETPVFGIPTVNIGDRQRGRTAAGNVINCKPDYDDIVLAIKKAGTPEFVQIAKAARSPFGDGGTSERIVGHIKDFLRNGPVNPAKAFYTL